MCMQRVITRVSEAHHPIKRKCTRTMTLTPLDGVAPLPLQYLPHPLDHPALHRRLPKANIRRSVYTTRKRGERERDGGVFPGLDVKRSGHLSTRLHESQHILFRPHLRSSKSLETAVTHAVPRRLPNSWITGGNRLSATESLERQLHGDTHMWHGPTRDRSHTLITISLLQHYRLNPTSPSRTLPGPSTTIT